MMMMIMIQQPNTTEGVVGKIDRREILPTTTEVTTTPKAKGEVIDNCRASACTSCVCLILYVLHIECMALGLGSREALGRTVSVLYHVLNVKCVVNGGNHDVD